jgi:hypothetical protein
MCLDLRVFAALIVLGGSRIDVSLAASVSAA